MASKRKECSIENYFKKNRDFFVVFVLCVSCSCIPYGDKIVRFSKSIFPKAFHLTLFSGNRQNEE